MPLKSTEKAKTKKGKKKIVGANIKELIKSGRTRKQSIAIALDKARKNGMKIPRKKKKK